MMRVVLLLQGLLEGQRALRYLHVGDLRPCWWEQLQRQLLLYFLLLLL